VAAPARSLPSPTAKFYPDQIRRCFSTHARLRASICLLDYFFGLFILYGSYCPGKQKDGQTNTHGSCFTWTTNRATSIVTCGCVQELYNEFIPSALPEPGPRKPVLISFHDDTRHRLSHLQSMCGFDPMKAELEILRYTQFAQSLAGCKVPLDKKVAAERAARFHALMTHCLQREHISPAGLYVCLERALVNIRWNKESPRSRSHRPLQQHFGRPW